MIVTHDSNLTGLSMAHLSLILQIFKGRNRPFVETLDLDEHGAPPVVCNLYGPIMDDPPIAEEHIQRINDQRTLSIGKRLALGLPIIRRSNLLTVVARGILVETYAGPIRPLLPQFLAAPDEFNPSRRFWQRHALGVGLEISGP